MTQPNTTQHDSVLVASEEDGKALALGLLTCASWSGTVRSRLFDYAKTCIKPGSAAERTVLDYIENAPYDMYRDINRQYIVPTVGVGPENWMWLFALLGGDNADLNEIRVFSPNGDELQICSVSQDRINGSRPIMSHSPLFSAWARHFLRMHEWKPEQIGFATTWSEQRVPAQSFPYLRITVNFAAAQSD